MTGEEKIARAFLNWQPREKEFMADPSPKNLAKLEGPRPGDTSMPRDH